LYTTTTTPHEELLVDITLKYGGVGLVRLQPKGGQFYTGDVREREEKGYRLRLANKANYTLVAECLPRRKRLAVVLNDCTR